MMLLSENQKFRMAIELKNHIIFEAESTRDAALMLIACEERYGKLQCEQMGLYEAFEFRFNYDRDRAKTASTSKVTLKVTVWKR